MKTIGWIIATPFIALALFVAARYMFCGPDREVIRVAKPVVKIIADDIVKNGIPESLEDIEGLPYVLEGCSEREVYWKGHSKVGNRQEASWMEVFFNCYFINKDKKYNVNIRFATAFKNNNWDGSLRIYNQDTYTSFGLTLKKKQGGTFYKQSNGVARAYHHGILCGSFKQ